MIQVTNLSKSFGEQVLFDNISFGLSPEEKVGLVGRNGHGKTTLFRIILGLDEYDSGVIRVPEHYRIGHLSQQIAFSCDSVLKEGCLGLQASEENWEATHRVEAILMGLGFSQDVFSLHPSKLSGGYQVRLNLVKLLVSEPNLLLLDEPTNYLDIVSMRWLTRFLRTWKNEMMLITHDREFMDSVTTHTLGVHRRKVKKIVGSTAKLYQQIEQEEEVYELTKKNQEKKREETEAFIRRFRAKATKAKAVQSRVKALEREDSLENLEEIRTLEFRFNATPFPGKWPMEVKELSFDYEEREPPLIKDFNLSVGKHDRIAVIGKNGKGKSTLLNLLARELEPWSGTVQYATNLKLSYFGQMNVNRLNPNSSVEDEILSVQPDLNRGAARGICGLMMFERDLALKKVSVLSGGEKSRVLLGKILVTPANMLLLDEPTNHLDIDSTNSLVEAIKHFPGAVIIVTHSEMILHQIATKLVVFDGGKVFKYDGSYQDFLDRVGWKDEEDLRKGEPKQTKVVGKKKLRKKRADVIARRSKVMNPLSKKIDEIEKTVVELELVVEENYALLLEASKEGFGDDAAKLSRTISLDKAKIDSLFEELDQATKELDSYAEEFEKELSKIGE